MLQFLDISEQKRLERQFIQSQKMQAVGQLAGGIAHDFNNLLTAMIGYCDLLLQRYLPNDPAYSDVVQIQQNANRAADLVRQLLAFSRQQTLQPKVVYITDHLNQLSDLLRRLIGAGIELKMIHGRDLWPVKVDVSQLGQVIMNLAVNARDAMTSVLTIRTSNYQCLKQQRMGHDLVAKGDYVMIEVMDTGQGIPPEHLEHIFEPFFSTKEVGEGTGLGLSMVYGIMKQTGGFVLVDSVLNEGTTFRILLPRHEGGEEEASAPPIETSSKDLTGGGTILLVEDEDAVRMFSARALREKGYRVIEADSGEAALETLKNGERFDLLVTDVVMPKMDGPTLSKKVRDLYPETKTIFISGYTEDTFRKNLDHNAKIHFLPKPFTLKDLASKVKEVLTLD
jgi:two-component system cell cycle sensor histidine kinase/response regulator CckA